MSLVTFFVVSQLLQRRMCQSTLILSLSVKEPIVGAWSSKPSGGRYGITRLFLFLAILEKTEDLVISLETFFVASHFFSKNGRELHICKEIPKLLSALRLHMLLYRESLDLWMYRDVQSIAHITYIIEMNTVENSTYQVSVVDNSEVFILLLT